MKNKFLVVISLIVACTVSVFAVHAYQTDIFYGDVDFNGKVTASDARTILRISAGLERDVTDDVIAVADTDKSGKITANDARNALRVAAGLAYGKKVDITEVESQTEDSIYGYIVVKVYAAENIIAVRNEYSAYEFVDKIDVYFTLTDEIFAEIYVKNPVSENLSALMDIVAQDSRLSAEI